MLRQGRGIASRDAGTRHATGAGMRLILLLSSLPLIACYGGERATTGQCPAGETCSAATPNGLQFVGASLSDELLFEGPAPTAIGGTQDIELEYDPGTGEQVPLDLPYQADDDGGLGVRIDHTTGPVVTVRGVESRSNYLRILDASDGTLFDRKELTGAAIDAIALVATDYEMIPDGAQLAWATGDQKIGVALTGAVQEANGPKEERIVDSSMQLALAGAEQPAWDELHLPAATAGTYAIAVTAGDRPTASVPLVVVDHADSVAPLSPPPGIAPNGGAMVCFQATAGGRYVVGLTWSYVIDGVAESAGGLTPNCIEATTTKTSGTVSVQASAGGQTATVTLAVGAMSRVTPPQAHAGVVRNAPTAGERASLVAAAAGAVR